MRWFNFSGQKEKVKMIQRMDQDWQQPIDPSSFFKGYTPGFSAKFNSEALLKLFNEVGDVYSIIDKISSKVADPCVNHVRYLANGKKKILGETDQLKAFQQLKFKEIVQTFLIHGNVPIWKLQTPGFNYPSKVIQLPSQRVYVIPEKHIGLTGEPVLTADQRFNPVVYYHYLLAGQYKVIPIDEIIYIKGTNPTMTGRDFYNGMSPLYSATRSVDILAGIYDTINTITQYRGALGFIKKNVRAGVGAIDPLAGATEGKEWTKEYFEKYGTARINSKGERPYPIGFTPYDLSWVRIDTPISDFMPVDLSRQQFGRLCNQFGISDVLFNNNEASTESNVKAAEIRAYQDCYVPTSKLILDQIAEGFGMTATNEYFESDWSEVACLQDDMLAMFQGKEAARKYYEGLYNSGFATKNQVLEGLGLPTVADPEYDKLKEPTQTAPNNGNSGVQA